MGGYTRVIRTGFRRGDRAPMAILEFVDREGEVRPAKPAVPQGQGQGSAAAAPLTLQQKLEQALAMQKQLKEALASTKPAASLVPAFPVPHAAATKWADVPAVWRERLSRTQAGGSEADISAAVEGQAAAGKGEAKVGEKKAEAPMR
jgi:hypothetical protein